MTELDTFIAEGLQAMGPMVDEKVTFRGSEYDANVSDLGTSHDWVAGGSKLLRRCSIHITTQSGWLTDVRTGEFITARGLQLKIESIDRDPTGYTFQCVEKVK